MKKHNNSDVSSTIRKRVIGILLTLVLLVGLTMPAMAEGGGDLNLVDPNFIVEGEGEGEGELVMLAGGGGSKPDPGSLLKSPGTPGTPTIELSVELQNSGLILDPNGTPQIIGGTGTSSPISVPADKNLEFKITANSGNVFAYLQANEEAVPIKMDGGADFTGTPDMNTTSVYYIDKADLAGISSIKIDVLSAPDSGTPAPIVTYAEPTGLSLALFLTGGGYNQNLPTGQQTGVDVSFGVPGDYGAGVIAIPMGTYTAISQVTAPGSSVKGEVTVNGSASDAFGGRLPAGKYFVYVLPTGGSGISGVINLKYNFENMTTPAGTVQNITGYILPAEAGASGLPGGTYAVSDAATAASNPTTTLTAVVDEALSLGKTIDTNLGAGSDTLVGIPYTDWLNDTVREYTVTYFITVGTNKAAGEFGRKNYTGITVTDTLNGYTSPPKSVKIFDGTTEITPSPISIGATETTFSFAVPNILSTGSLMSNKTFKVEVVYDKEDYTKTSPSSSFTTPVLTNNNVKMTVAPAGASDVTSSGPVSHKFGFEVMDPNKANFKIVKYVKADSSAAGDLYTSTVRGSGTVVQFTLTDNDTTNPDPNSPYTVSIGDDGSASFSGIVATPAGRTYTLSESVVIPNHTPGANATVRIQLVGGVPVVRINGGTTIDYNGGTTPFRIDNVNILTASLQVTAQAETPYIGPSSKIPADVTVTITNTTDPSDTQTLKLGTDGVETFNNLMPDATYTVSYGPLTNYTAPANQSVKVSTGKNETTGLYTSNGGSFKLPKIFIDEAGQEVVPASYSVKFQLYDGANAVGDPIIINQNTNGEVIDQLFPGGTAASPKVYTLKEVSVESVYINGIERKDEFPAYTGDGITVGIIKSSDYSVFENTTPSGSSSLVDANGAVKNPSNYGQLRIQNVDLAGTALTTGYSFTITSSSFTKTVTAPGLYAVPPGTYTVTVTPPAGVGLIDSRTVTSINVFKNQPAGPGYTITGRNLTGSSNRTAAYMWGKFADVTGTKVKQGDTATKLSGAVFTLYQESGGNYDLVKNASNANVTATSDANGVFTFPGLPPGNYMLVETTTPAGYVTPGYVADCYTGTTLKSLILSAPAGAPTFTVPNTSIGVTTPFTPAGIQNIPNYQDAKVVVKLVSALDGSALSGGSFELKKGTETWTTVAADGTIASKLEPGTYTLTQTSAPDGYDLCTHTATIVVAADGTISMSPFTCDNDRHASSVANNTATITFSNLPFAKLDILKLGETKAYVDDGSGNYVPDYTFLAGAKFIVEGTPAGTYAQFTETSGVWNMTGTTTTAASATEIISGANGMLYLGNLDPKYAPYKLIETFAPSTYGIDYELITDTISLSKESNASGYIRWIAEIPSGGVIKNTVDRWRIDITKWLVKENPSGSGHYTVPDTDGYDAQGNKLGSAGAVFAIYAQERDGDGNLQWNGPGATNPKYDMTAPVETIVTGTGSASELNKAISSQLPEGNYLVVELQAPVWAVPLPGGNMYIAGPIGPDGKPEYFVVNPDGVQFEVNLVGGDKSYHVGNDDNRGPGGPLFWAQAFVDKLGYYIDEKGDEVLNGPLTGVNFEVQVAYLDKNGDYQPFYDAGTYTSGRTTGGFGEFLSDLVTLRRDVSGSTLTGIGVRNITGATVASIDTTANPDWDNTAPGAIAFLITEIGPLPPGYVLPSPAYFTVPIDWTISGVQQNGIAYDPNNTVPQIVKNYMGDRKIQIEKWSLAGTGTALSFYSKIDGAEFAIYKASSMTTTLAEAKAAGSYITTLRANVSGFDTLVLPAGYYIMEETKVPKNYQNYGIYSVGPTASVSFTDGVIGPFAVNQSSSDTLLIQVGEWVKPAFTIQNAGNGSTSTLIGSTYTVKYTGSASVAELNASVNIGGTALTFNSSKTATVNIAGTSGNISAALDGLLEGTYDIFETVVATPNYNKTVDATTGTGVRVTVAGGNVTAVKTSGGNDIGTTTGAAANTWISAALGTTGVKSTTITLNHKPYGSLKVQLGYVNATGTWVDGVTGLPSGYSVTGASFAIVGVSDPSFTSTTYSWTANTTAGAPLKYLPAGTYTVTLSSLTTAPTGTFVTDTEPVYVTIGTEGTVFLKNNTASFFKGTKTPADLGTSTNPYDSVDSPSGYFYSKLNLGEYQVNKKSGDATAGVNSQAGAVFSIYPSVADAQAGTNARTEKFTIDATGQATITLPPGTHYIKETAAAVGYVPRQEVFTIEVLPNTVPNFDGTYNNVSKDNAIGIINASKTKMIVGKVTRLPNAVSGAAGLSPVGGFTFVLYKLNTSSGNYEAVLRKPTTTLVGANYGFLELDELDEGTYKIVESDPSTTTPQLFAYLDFDDVYSSLVDAPTFTIAYNNGELVITPAGNIAGDGKSAPDASTWDASKKTLTVFNKFDGTIFGILKNDYDSGDPIESTGTFRFALYNAAHVTNPAGAGAYYQEISGQTDTTGHMYFDPVPNSYINPGDIWYIEELATATGYILDNAYGGLERNVTIVNGTYEYIATFLNKKETGAASLAINKAFTSPAAAITTPLSEAALSATYRLSVNAVNNMTAMQDFTITDDQMKFYNGSTEITGPTYNVTGVSLGRSVSNHAQFNTSGSVTGFDAAASPVHAKVVLTDILGATAESAWTELGATSTAITITMNNVAKVEVFYSDTQVPATKPTVGAYFVPGPIDVNVTFNQYVQPAPPPALTKEVNRIGNLAKVSASGGNLANNSVPSNAVSLSLPINPLPTMSIAKQFINAYKVDLTTDPSNPSLVAIPVVSGSQDILPGDVIEFDITITNSSTNSRPIVDPIIADYMVGKDMAAYLESGAIKYTVGTLPSGITAPAAPVTDPANKIVTWAFTGDLDPGESITITFYAQLGSVVVGTSITNVAFATSGKTLAYSADNPTGAQFTPSGSSIKEPDSTGVFADLTNILGDRGQYAKAETTAVMIQKSGLATTDMQIKSGTGGYSTAVNVLPGATLDYRMRLNNGSATQTLDNLSFSHNLLKGILSSTTPDTLWTSGLQDLITIDKSSFRVSEESTGNTIDPSRYSLVFGDGSDSGVITTVKSFDLVITDSTYKLAVGETLIVDFSLKLPAATSISEALYSTNLFRTAYANFSETHKFAIGNVQNVAANSVSATLVKPTSITGTVWSDNFDGVLGTATDDPRLSGVTVRLYDAATFDATDLSVGLLKTATTVNGVYTFDNLDSKYATPLPQYVVVFTNPQPADVQFVNPGVAFIAGNSANAIASHATNFITTSTTGSGVPQTFGYTGIISLDALDASNVVNAGLYTIPRVIYNPGDAGSNTTVMPNPLITNWQSDTTYTVSNTTPVWPNHDFAGWKSFTENGSNGPTTTELDLVTGPATTSRDFAQNDTFTMPRQDVVLVAQWSAPMTVTINYRVRTFSNDMSAEITSPTIIGGTLTKSVDADIPRDTGNPFSSVEKVNPNYEFVGWYSDIPTDLTDPWTVAKTTSGTTTPPLTAGRLDPDRNTSGQHFAHTYYAVFKEGPPVKVNYEVVTWQAGGTALAALNNGGTLTKSTETVAPMTGTPTASVNGVLPGYTFKGWKQGSAYTSPAQTVTSPTTVPPLSEGRLDPEPPLGGFVDGTTYYAHFEEDGPVTINYVVRTFTNNRTVEDTTNKGGTISAAGGTAGYAVSESVAPATGTPTASVMSENPRYTFIGWFSAIDVSDPSPASHVWDAVDPSELEDTTGSPVYTDGKINPALPAGGKYVDGTTYYAAFVEGPSIELNYEVVTWASITGTPVLAVPTEIGGTLDVYTDSNVAPMSGNPSSQVMTVKNGYRFLGWKAAAAYSTADQQNNMGPNTAASTAGLSNGKLDPARPTNGYVDGTTYYAHFVENDPVDILYTTLTIGSERALNNDPVLLTILRNANDPLSADPAHEGGTIGSILSATPPNLLSNGFRQTVPPVTGNPSAEVDSIKGGYEYLGWFSYDPITGQYVSQNGNSEPGGLMILAHNPLKKINPPKTGGVYVNGSTYYAVFQQLANVQVNFEARTFSTAGAAIGGAIGGNVTPASMSVAPATGNPSSLAVTNTGYSFQGWYQNEACTMPVGTKLGTYLDATVYPAPKNGTHYLDNETYYARFVPLRYTVSYRYAGITPPTPPALPVTVTYDVGARVTVAPNAPNVPGWRFNGWDTPAGSSFYMPARNVVIAGTWTPVGGPPDDDDPPPTDITDEPTPLDDPPIDIVDDPVPRPGVWCWVHWYILAGIIISAIGSIFVISRRQKFSDKLKSYEDDLLKDDEEEKKQGLAG